MLARNLALANGKYSAGYASIVRKIAGRKFLYFLDFFNRVIVCFFGGRRSEISEINCISMVFTSLDKFFF
ncbi:MAG: hypothetical protein ACP5OB_01905 [Candidatus Ratteibacteria bacterium]